MDIVDSGLHLNHLGSIEAGLAAMDAVGIAAAMWDEYDGATQDEAGNFPPGVMLENGVFRPTIPMAHAMGTRYPDRVGVLRRVNFRDPGLGDIARQLAEAPYGSAMRMVLWTADEYAAAAAGALDPVLRAAADFDVPLMVVALGPIEVLLRYAEAFPSVTLGVDHCGALRREHFPDPDFPRVGRILARSEGGIAASVDAICKLAKFPNTVVKWSLASLLLSVTPYPFPDMTALLARVVEQFGCDRVMWGSDTTVNPFTSWAEEVFAIREAPSLSDEDKGALLAKTARRVFRLPR